MNLGPHRFQHFDHLLFQFHVFLQKNQEDARLIAIVNVFGAKKWPQISHIFGGRRNPKQCRERWMNHLNPVSQPTLLQ